MAKPRFWKSALTDDHGEFDVGQIGLAALIIMIVGAVPWILILSTYAVIVQRAYDPQPTGVAVAAICGGFAAALAAFAPYRRADSAQRPPPPPA